MVKTGEELLDELVDIISDALVSDKGTRGTPRAALLPLVHAVSPSDEAVSWKGRRGFAGITLFHHGFEFCFFQLHARVLGLPCFKVCVPNFQVGSTTATGSFHLEVSLELWMPHQAEPKSHKYALQDREA